MQYILKLKDAVYISSEVRNGGKNVILKKIARKVNFINKLTVGESKLP